MCLRWWKTGRWTTLIAVLAALLIPTFAMAAGGENVKLEFSDQDKIYLYLSLGLGFLAIVMGYVFQKQVLAKSTGNDAMREVAKAIEAGALAYLAQQRKLMGIFVILLAVGLYFLYQGQFGQNVGTGVAVCFVLGVLASYGAGYLGMVTAVRGNVRTAAAALNSKKEALETAFRSGAVAGMYTVGLGLIGATAVFLLFPAEAMKLLVGFGFGGSLAALFMRVGGGIYTKAADVGADLVGKVEAGIPEDDPRNPAVIADNVGDNVGDCAGMAADVFESYEVTLVAAIVLGAATAAIFDTATWMRLVMFALLARGIGIVASIIGIYMVKGDEDEESDPLHSIQKGFYGSGVIAAILTVVLAYWMMGGMPGSNSVIQTSTKTTREQWQRNILDVMVAEGNKLAIAQKKEFKEVAAEDVAKSAGFMAATPGFSEDDRLRFVSNYISPFSQFDPNNLPEPRKVDGLTKVDLNSPNFAKVASFAVQKPDQTSGDPANPPAPQFVTLKEAFGGKELIYMQVSVQQTAPGQQNPPAQTFIVGPSTKEYLAKQFEEVKKQGTEVKEDATFPATIYVDGKDNLYVALDSDGKTRFDQVAPVLGYYKMSPEEVSNPPTDGSMPPQPNTAEPLLVTHKNVEWWRFVVCILFGIFMAFLFEKLTDYYVSFKKKPVREVASVATTGPAPMIINGFAYGLESSVFSVFAIVAALMAPLLIFPSDQFGGYLLSFYGIALVGLGLLTTTGFILAMDTFGPISDNAQGVFEMSGAGHDNPKGARAVQILDAAGNTTKALTKGFAIATAVVAAVALFHAYVDAAKLTEIGMRLEVPEIFLGLLVGGAAPYLFSAFSINAVGRAAFDLINDVRDQFRNDPGIMKGTSKPDYGRCVAIVTAAAQKELLGPGILAISLPVLVAFGFGLGKQPVLIDGVAYNLVGAQALGGFLAGTILSGQLMAVLLANSGGMWDNAKKLIEDGMHGGKGTDEHKAAVVCDTVGDPFKDTAGPALNPLIKVMNLIALLIVPIVIQPMDSTMRGGVTLVAAAALILAIWQSKKGSMSTALDSAKADAAAKSNAPAAVEAKAEEVAEEATEEAKPEEKTEG
ncbi:hypothetical protein CCB81_00620 [Armatimonadetes bacterium Uphvl-Ar2]|jgi:K(+)-stimulated pyrophosphate-energized sodium pump|nr:hypothetical protein CCB81_00620 [Armatimonadetes bacterium Uphvl-Ar2]